jgi:hypothetical protein
MIEIKPLKTDKSKGEMYIDDQPIDSSLVNIFTHSNGSCVLTIRDLQLSKRLFTYKPSDFSLYIEQASFSYSTHDWSLLSEVTISRVSNEVNDKTYPFGFRREPIQNTFDLGFICEPNLSKWNKEYSFSDYVAEFIISKKKNSESKEIHFTVYDKYYSRGFSFGASIPNCVFNDSFENTINEWICVFAEIHQQVESKLLSSKQNNSVVLTFDFPDEVKAPCEQYLMYFSQFLRDLGVKATSNLNHKAGQVLFTVTPDNPEQALDKIRAALEVYLQLPASPIDAYPDVSTEIEVQRLTANIQHFKGQLSLAKAEIRAAESAIELKDATIQVLRLTLDEQNRLLSGDISGSIKNVTPRPKDKDKEDLIEGIVSLKPYDAKVADVNLPEIWRRLKKFFNDK